MMSNNKFNIAKLIDHSLLRPDATEADVVSLCEEAKRYGFFSVCIHPFFVKKAKEILSETDIRVTTVTGFPLGMTLTQVKVYEAVESVLQGADELDMVINLGLAKANNWKAVEKEIRELITATPEVIHKIIIETCYLTDEEKKKASLAVINSGAEFIKTSTGFAPEGAKVKDVMLIKSVTDGKIGIKAAGGIRTLKDVKAFIEAGATRIGTSSGVNIMKELNKS
jgi:deoxyribose-phosphate aldolase